MSQQSTLRKLTYIRTLSTKELFIARITLKKSLSKTILQKLIVSTNCIDRWKSCASTTCESGKVNIFQVTETKIILQRL